MPNVFSANYQPNQAVNEYQTQLKAQNAADNAVVQPEGKTLQAAYALADLVPDWNQLRNLGGGQYGLNMYSTGHLEESLVQLHNSDLFDKATDPRYYHFTRAEQIERVHTELVSRIN